MAPETTLVSLHERLASSRLRLLARDRQIVATQTAIAGIPAPTGSEASRARWMARRFAACGARDVRLDEAGNVLATRPGSEDVAPIAVFAHLDTVFPAGTPLVARRERGTIVAPGIGDNARGLAVMLALLEEIDGLHLRTRRPILFVGTTGEEGSGNLRGARHLLATVPVAPVAVIALDGAGDHRIVTRALGSRRYRITIRGPGGHSWAAFGAANAVNAAAGAVSRLTALALPSAPRTTLTVSRIGGGTSINAIPDTAWLEVDVRSLSATELDRIDRDVRRAVRDAVESENARRLPCTPALHADIEFLGERPSGEVPRDNPLVRAAEEATRLVGREPELAAASTDANIPISRGIPAIAIGAGGRGGATHTPDEWFDNHEGAIGIARALTILVAAAGLTP